MMTEIQVSKIIRLLYPSHLLSILKVYFQLSSHFKNNVSVIMLLICPSVITFNSYSFIP